MNPLNIQEELRMSASSSLSASSNDIGVNSGGLPENVTISTMSATCKLGTTVNLEVIHKNIKLNEDNVLSIKYKDMYETLLPAVKKGKSKKNNKVRNFFNQITMVIRAGGERTVNLKLFCNGSVQMTGCKRVEDCHAVIHTLIDMLKGINLAVDNEKIGMQGFKIDMINSNFKVDYMINRRELHTHISKIPDVYSRFDPNNHAGLIIKYFANNDNKKGISVFVFESGNIIITGAKNQNHILVAHKFITDVLKQYDVKKVDIEKFVQSTNTLSVTTK